MGGLKRSVPGAGWGRATNRGPSLGAQRPPARAPSIGTVALPCWLAGWRKRAKERCCLPLLVLSFLATIVSPVCDRVAHQHRGAVVYMDTYTVQGDAWLTFHARLLFMCFGRGRWYGIDANPHLLCINFGSLSRNLLQNRPSKVRDESLTSVRGEQADDRYVLYNTQTHTAQRSGRPDAGVTLHQATRHTQ